MPATDLEQLRAEAQQIIARLQTERDDLKVRLHLARAEVREEWDKVEARWHELEYKAHQLGTVASAASKDVGVAMRLLGDELTRAYQNLRRTLEH